MSQLDKNNIEDILALTPVQEGMFFHYLKEPQSHLYFEQLYLDIPGEIDVEIFEKAWNVVIATNEMLRAVFRWEKVKRPAQIILKEYKLRLKYYDFLDNVPNEKKRLVEKIKDRDRKNTFDLQEVPFRVTLCKIEENGYAAIVSYHHILYDGWSTGIILKEFIEAYNVLYRGEKFLKLPVKTKFKEFIQWIQNQDKNEQKQYWKKYLEGLSTQTGLPIKKQKLEKVKAIENYHVFVKADMKEKLDMFMKKNNLTLASFIYSAWGILLQRYGNNNDVILGTTVSGRSAQVKNIEDMVGLFINTLPLRVTGRANEKVKHFLLRLNSELQIREQYAATPLVKIKEYSGLENDETLFNTVVVIENYPLDSRLIQANTKGSLVVHSYSITEITNYDLTVGVSMRHGIDINFSFDKELFESKAIGRLSRHFLNIIVNMLKNFDTGVPGIEILSKKEKQQILEVFNNTYRDYPEDQTIHRLFEVQVERTPDHIAVIGKAQSAVHSALTYRELNKMCSQLACLLREKGVKPDTIAAIMVERSIEMIIGILGILKSGGAYLPIDLDYPEERINYMLADSNTNVLVTTGTLAEFSTLPSSHLHLSPVPATSLAYVIYTSGTTGHPKGVLVEHRNAVNVLNWFGQAYRLSGGVRVLQMTDYTFDPSVEQIFGTLIHGAVLCMVNRELRGDIKELRQYIDTHRIHMINFAPALLKELLVGKPRLKSLQAVISGGEKLDDSLKERILEKGYTLYNHYGPTETTIEVLTTQCSDEPVTLGKPIDNINAYILDNYYRLQPVEVPGQLYLSGEGLARGYLNNPGLTNKKFLWGGPGGAIFSKSAPPGRRRQKIYKTGDLARWLPEGDIEFLGRMDHQVKIRGFRIELEEIENQLVKHPKIKEAVVLLKTGEAGDNHLYAYIVPNAANLPYTPEPSKAAPLDFSQLQDYLAKKLPVYMIPSYFASIDTIPVTLTGEIDCSKLPGIEIEGIGVGYVAPRNKLEKTITNIWSEVLHIEREKISIKSNFFRSGGHSLKAVELILRVHKELDINIPLAELFKRPTIEGMAGYIKNSAKDKYEAIKPAEKKDYYTLSSAQKRLYYLQHMDEESTVYNMVSVIGLEGNPDKSKLEHTFNELVRRHESLRTSFHPVNNGPVQQIHQEVEFEIQYYDLSSRETEKAWKKETGGQLSPFIIHHSFNRPFNLSQAPLLRVGLIEENDKKIILVVDMHHIISDGISVEILVKDFGALYTGRDSPRLRLRYKDYSQWQHREKDRERTKKQKKYWKKEFEGEIPILDLPTDFLRPAVQRFEGGSLNFEISRTFTQKLNALTIKNGTTLYMMVLALYNIFLSKMSHQEDIVIGTPVMGRRHADLQSIIGMFVNTLPLRNYPAGEKTFNQFLQELKEKTLQAFENQEYPYEDLVDQVVVNRDASRNPLFDTSFLLQDREVPQFQLPGVKCTPYTYETNTSKFDLTLEGTRVQNTLLFRFEYSTKLFKRETIQRLIGYFKNIVSGALKNKEGKLSELEILSKKEKKQVLADFNSTGADYPRDKTTHALFEEQVNNIPDHIAVIGQSIQVIHEFPLQITYNQLNRQSNQLAHLLRSNSVKPNTIVAIMAERSLEMLIGIFGILKASCAYLPIDPNYPEDRISYMLKDSNVEVLVTTPKLQVKVKAEVEERFIEIIDISSLSSFSTLTSTCQVSPANLAYVIYTSGSTGKPKGVMIEHPSVVNRLNWMQRFYPIGKQDVILQKTPIVFDVSVWELFWWSMQGASVCLLEPGEEKNPEAIVKVIPKNTITTMHFVPSMLNSFLEYIAYLGPGDLMKLSSLRQVFSSGEALGVQQVETFNRLLNESDGTKLVNLYGPTEATVDVSFFNCSPAGKYEKIPIGRPIDNIRLYITNKNGGVQPIGVPGELCISGDGLARGYLNRPGLTGEKFDHDFWDYQDDRDKRKKEKKVPGKNYLPMQPCSHAAMRLSPHHSPHYPIPPSHHYPIYHTGDLARWLPDGNIEFLGRIDRQVKLRGFRIELEEIEAQLLQYNEIKQAVVVTAGNNEKDKYLAAYIVSTGEIDIPQLKEYLLNNLPDYMIPSCVMQIEEIPLTANGKVNRQALPAPEIKTYREYAAPGGPIEKKLAEIWTEILNVNIDGIGIYDNFFALGGHSLKAITLVSAIHNTFNVRLPLAEIFKRPTIRRLSQYIKDAVTDGYVSIGSTEKKEYYTLSSAQKRLYFFQQLDEQGTSYNIPWAAILDGCIDTDRLENVFRELIERHESLRTSFAAVEEEPVQRIHDKVKFKIEYDELGKEGTRGLPPLSIPAAGNWQQLAAITIKNFIRPFDLSKSPLLRVGLVKLPHTPTTHQRKKPGNKYLLMVDMHHIITDGVSMEIFRKEFQALHAQETLAPLRLHYKDFSHWQNREKTVSSLLKQQEYWTKQFEDQIPVVDLPTDFPRPPVRGFAGDEINFELNIEQTRALRILALEEETTLFTVMFTLYCIFLAKICSQDDIVVGTPVAGRQHSDSAGIIGMFVNTLVLRSNPSGEKTFKEFLAEMRENTFTAFENQDYQYENLVEQVSLTRDTSRNPLFDVMLALHPMPVSEVVTDGLKLKPYEFKNRISKFDLTLRGSETKHTLLFTLEFSTRLFKQTTVQRLVRYFKTVISTVLERPAEKILEIEIISSAEKKQLLTDFNASEADYPLDKSILRLIEEQVERSPDHIAVIGQSVGVIHEFPLQITYNELNRQSHQLAYLLQTKGVKPEIMVGIMIGPCIQMIIGILGILTAGGAYLPIDPLYPEERITYMLKDSNVEILVTTPKLQVKSEIDERFIDIIDISNLSSFSTLTSTSTCQVSPANLAYIIYTSGSTGKPKGVMIRHRSLNNLCHWHNQRYSITPRDKAAKYAGFGFDASVWEIFPYLIVRTAICIIKDKIKTDIYKLNEYFETLDITIAFLPPQICEQLMRLDNRSLRVLLTGGDKLNVFIKRNYQLANNYGPTENTVVTTSFIVEENYHNIPIGKPISNTQLYVLDKYGKLQPVGVPGELYIGGMGLARGYLNRPELTTEKFCLRRPGGRFLLIPCKSLQKKQTFEMTHRKNDIRLTVNGLGVPPPFLPEGTRGLAPLLYRTGDLTRWLADGNIEFLGRMDSQVKIRGFRIELGEIESRLLSHPGVKEAVVLAKETDGKNNHSRDKYLAAYIIPRKGVSLSVLDLKEYLSRALPAYMIPHYFVFPGQIPLTASGKVDRKALPPPENTGTGIEYAPPRDALERKLVKIWSDLLLIDENTIGINDNFFQLGGHSLKATRLTARIHKVFNVKPSLVEMFKRPMIREMGQYIKTLRQEKFAAIPPVPEKDYYALSSGQNRLYTMQQMDRQSTVYNIPSQVILQGDIDEKRLAETFCRLIKRHESFRTSFEIAAGQPVQKIHKEVEFAIEGLAVPKPQSVTSTIKNFIRPFDLSRAPLLRVVLIPVEEKKHLLMTDIHHIIADGASMGTLVQELMDIYSGRELPPLRLRYKDYAEWQNRQKESETLAKQEAYWLKEFAGKIPAVNLPTDYDRQLVQGFEGDTLDFEVRREETYLLKTLAEREGATLYLVLLSICYIMLAKISGQEDIVIGTLVTGRSHDDLGQVIGMFVNTLALRNYPTGEKTFHTFLQQVKNRTLEAFEYQDYQFEELVEKLPLTRETNRNPLFDVSFVFQNMDIPEVKIPGLKLTPHEIEHQNAKFDITLIGKEKESRLLFTIRYRTKLFKKETIKRYARYFNQLISIILENQEVQLGEIVITHALAAAKPAGVQADFTF